MNRTAKPESGTLEAALGELEYLLADLDNGHVGFEAAVGRYVRGAELLGHCRRALNAAERRIAAIDREAGQPVARAMNISDDRDHHPGETDPDAGDDATPTPEPHAAPPGERASARTESAAPSAPKAESY